MRPRLSIKHRGSRRQGRYGTHITVYNRDPDKDVKSKTLTIHGWNVGETYDEILKFLQNYREDENADESE